MKVGYNFVLKESIEKGDLQNLGEHQMGIIEFLRKVKERALLNEDSKYPRDIQVVGLDYLLYYSKNPEEFSKKLQDILVNAIEYLNRNYFSIQFPCEKLEKWEKLVAKIKGESITFYSIFGPLQEKTPEYYYRQFNITS